MTGRHDIGRGAWKSVQFGQIPDGRGRVTHLPIKTGGHKGPMGPPCFLERSTLVLYQDSYLSSPSLSLSFSLYKYSVFLLLNFVSPNFYWC